MKKIFDTRKPIFIAEISCNHNGKLSNAKKLIKLAKKSGADLVKLQTYTPDTMTLNVKNNFFKIKKGIWKGKNLWSLYSKSQTPFTWQKTLFDYAKKIGITCFSTPFDESAVNLLEKLNCPFYKISSFEMTDVRLIKKVAQTKKPLIISTGTSSIKEISLAYKTARRHGAKKIVLLYCVSNYPAKIDDFNLNNIKILRKKFKCKVGLSDHSTDTSVMIGAIALGALFVEKHIALPRQRTGFDIKFSLRGDEIKNFINLMQNTYKLVSKQKFVRDSSEKENKFFRKSIFVAKNIKKNEKFNEQNIRIIRPGMGLEPIYFDLILGKKSKKNLKKGTPFKKSFY